MPDGPVLAATKVSVAAANFEARDKGAVAVLLDLAKAVDVLNDLGGIREDGKLDNVSVPTYLKFCESLGLTPAGRAKLAEKKPEAPGGKLRSLQSAARKAG